MRRFSNNLFGVFLISLHFFNFCSNVPTQEGIKKNPKLNVQSIIPETEDPETQKSEPSTPVSKHPITPLKEGTATPPKVSTPTPPKISAPTPPKGGTQMPAPVKSKGVGPTIPQAGGPIIAEKPEEPTTGATPTATSIVTAKPPAGPTTLEAPKVPQIGTAPILPITGQTPVSAPAIVPSPEVPVTPIATEFPEERHFRHVEYIQPSPIGAPSAVVPLVETPISVPPNAAPVVQPIAVPPSVVQPVGIRTVPQVVPPVAAPPVVAPRAAAPPVAAPPVAAPSAAPVQSTPGVVTPKPIEIKATVPKGAPVVAVPLEAELRGLETAEMEQPQGNWLFKRVWWKNGQTLYEKIQALVETITEQRLEFFKKRSEWDKKIFDPFFMEVGVGRGMLEELLSNLINQSQEERNKEGALNEEERAVLAKIEAEKHTLEELAKDVQKINEIDNKIDEAVEMLIKQIGTARNYEHQAWQNFKNIAQEINDKKARELYITMNTHWQNINQISDYLKGRFLQYFNQLGSLGQEQVTKVLSTIKALRENGVDLKKQWMSAEDKAMHEKEITEKKAAEETKRKVQRGFVGKIVDSFTSGVSTTWHYIKSGATSLWNMTFGRFFKKAGSAPQQMHIPSPEVIGKEGHEITNVPPKG
jgi:hypothetical protein